MENITAGPPKCQVRSAGCDPRAPVAFDRAYGHWCCLPCWAALLPIPDRVPPGRLEIEFPATAARMKWRCVPDPMA